jgi:hypothetical protein
MSSGTNKDIFVRMIRVWLGVSQDVIIWREIRRISLDTYANLFLSGFLDDVKLNQRKLISSPYNTHHLL